MQSMIQWQVPRVTYFPLVCEPVRTHFLEAAPAREDELWLEYKGQPLKWHVPVGSLYDVAYGTEGVHELPWKITVHFQGFPAKKLMRCRTMDVVRSHFINSVKQACFLITSTTRGAMSLNSDDHAQLWGSLARADIGDYKSILGKLVNDATTPLRLPIRICLRDYDEKLAQLRILQPSVTPAQLTGEPHSLGTMLCECLCTDEESLPEVEVIAHGLRLENPMEIPLMWLYRNLSHPDMFLYIIVLHPSSQRSRVASS